jgi:outer membrane receptor protein involved in Fe transport
VSAQHSVTYANALAADNVGVELELRHDFGWLHDVLDGAYVAGNGALIYSQVSLDESAGIQTSNIRPLQGQSPYVLNLQAGWDTTLTGSRVAVLYNVVGPRITEVGAAGAPDIYEQPFHRLDIVARQQLPYGFSLGVKAENLLDLPASRTQGGKVTEQVRFGRGMSASLGWSF